jgi:allantoinase
MKEMLLYSNRCFIENQFREATIHLKNGIIHQIYHGEYRVAELPFMNYQNQILMPGIIDAHVHINEPGRTHWEGFDTATKASALGGVTTLIEMPLNASPVTTNVPAFEAKLQSAKNQLHVNCGFYGGVIPGNSADIEPLIKAGVFGIKGFLIHSGIDEFPNINKAQLEEIAPILAKYDIPLLLHCELETDEVLPPVLNPKSYAEYLASRPPSWEINAIDLALDIQQRFDCKVHIVHLATAKALPIIEERRALTDKLTVETCAHYLYFNAEDIPDAAPIYKCAPPIRERANNQELWKAVKLGSIDFLASDHSPAPPEIKKLKEGNLFEAWGGIAGLQFTLSALWKANTILSLEEFIPLLTSQPAKFLGLSERKGRIKVGLDADITIWDEQATFEVNEEMIAHRHKACPYLGETLKGKILDVLVNGELVVQNGKLAQLNKGKILLKQSF